MNKLSAYQAHSDVRRRNAARQRILQALRQSGPMPRADLGRLTGFSPASISVIIGGLLAEKILVEHEDQGGAAGPGRPGIRIGFNPARGAAVGLWVGLNKIVLQGVDLAGDLVASRKMALPLSRAAADEITDMLVDACRSFIQSEMADLIVLALGVAFQGLIDQRSGTVVWSPVVAAADLPLVAGMNRDLGIPVFLENDASAMAYAICRHQPDLQKGFTACVMIGDGVGLGLLRDGVLLRGAKGGGSEFGHVKLDATGPQCRCGARGCIESYVADYALYRDAITITETPSPGTMQPTEMQMRALTGQAVAGNAALAQLFDGAGRALGRGLAMLVQLFQPDHVVLCGPGVRAHELVVPALQAEIERGTLLSLRQNLQPLIVDFKPVQLTEGIVLQALETIDIGLAEEAGQTIT